MWNSSLKHCPRCFLILSMNDLTQFQKLLCVSIIKMHSLKKRISMSKSTQFLINDHKIPKNQSKHFEGMSAFTNAYFLLVNAFCTQKLGFCMFRSKVNYNVFQKTTVNYLSFIVFRQQTSESISFMRNIISCFESRSSGL